MVISLLRKAVIWQRQQNTCRWILSRSMWLGLMVLDAGFEIWRPFVEALLPQPLLPLTTSGCTGPMFRTKLWWSRCAPTLWNDLLLIVKSVRCFDILKNSGLTTLDPQLWFFFVRALRFFISSSLLLLLLLLLSAGFPYDSSAPNSPAMHCEYSNGQSATSGDS